MLATYFKLTNYLNWLSILLGIWNIYFQLFNLLISLDATYLYYCYFQRVYALFWA